MTLVDGAANVAVLILREQQTEDRPPYGQAHHLSADWPRERQAGFELLATRCIGDDRQQIGRSEACKERELLTQLIACGRVDPLQLMFHQSPERRFERAAQVIKRASVDHLMQPLIAPRQQIAQELNQTLDAIAEVGDERLETVQFMRALAEAFDQLPASRFVERSRILGWFENASGRRQNRQTAREQRVECVNRLNAQARGMLRETPTAARVRLANGAGKFPGRALVRRIGRRSGGALDCSQNAAAHLCSGLARKRDRQNLFGKLDARQQRQKALRQQLGFARTRRRLHDERALGIERLRAGERVPGHWSPPSASSAERERSWMRQNVLR